MDLFINIVTSLPHQKKNLAEMFNVARRYFSSRSLFSSEKLKKFTADLPSKINKETSLVRTAHQYQSYFSLGLFQNVEVVEKAQFMNDLGVDEKSIKGEEIFRNIFLNWLLNNVKC